MSSTWRCRCWEATQPSIAAVSNTPWRQGRGGGRVSDPFLLVGITPRGAPLAVPPCKPGMVLQLSLPAYRLGGSAPTNAPHVSGWFAPWPSLCLLRIKHSEQQHGGTDLLSPLLLHPCMRAIVWHHGHRGDPTAGVCAVCVMHPPTPNPPCPCSCRRVRRGLQVPVLLWDHLPRQPPHCTPRHMLAGPAFIRGPPGQRPVADALVVYTHGHAVGCGLQAQ
jgi:hypothetical protein